MATLNLSTNGPSIRSSYQKVVDAPLPSGASASSSTYGQWAVYSVQAPLMSAFQNDSTKESVLKVQSTGEGELLDLIEEFSEGRIQFAFAKVKDPNSGLPKSVLIAWCGEGVPERTKGYFTSHLTAVSKLLHGYHVQVTARSDRDLTPEAIISKVADASGAKYGGAPASNESTAKPAPPIASKPFMPSKMEAASGFAPLGNRSRVSQPTSSAGADGWGEDAPEPTRRQLEKVESAYKPTKVNIADLTSQRQEPSRFVPPGQSEEHSNVVRGGYQPIGKVDLAAIRREAKEQGQVKDDRPSIVKGSYEPIGKVDIAAIRAKAQGAPPPPSLQETQQDDRPASLTDRSAAFQQEERLTSLPKPKVANRFASSNSFNGTKALSPGSFGNSASVGTPQVGSAGRSFAQGAVKSPAQLWAEKKAREGGAGAGAGAGASSVSQTNTSSTPVAAQNSGGWQSGYSGRKWNSVQTTKTGQSHTSAEPEGQENHAEQDDTAPTGFGSARDRFNAAPPPLDNLSKPNAGVRGVPMPGLPQRQPSSDARPDEEHVDLPPPPPQPRSPSPEPSESPVRIAMPVSRTAQPAEIETEEPASIPTASLEKVASQAEPEFESRNYDEDDARIASQAAAHSTFGHTDTVDGASSEGKRALVQYDYEKAEDNELELKEGEYVHNIEMVDEDWWLGENSRGEKGLFPSNYVEVVAEDEHDASGPAPIQAQESEAAPAAGPPGGQRLPTATAQYEYEAAEDNELSFPDGAKISDVEFPDEDWWLGKYNGKQGLFPANYVQLDE